MVSAGLEAALWCPLGILGPALVRWWWPKGSPRLGEWSSDLQRLGPWVHGILPAYLALTRGAILERDTGLHSHMVAEWVSGILAFAIGLAAAAYWMRQRSPGAIVVPEAWRVALDEPRWALYRAAGILWTGSPWAGVAVGAGLMMVEWALTWRPWRDLSNLQGSAWTSLARGAASSLFFICTWNFWLTMATQTGLVLLIRRSRSSSSLA